MIDLYSSDNETDFIMQRLNLQSLLRSLSSEKLTLDFARSCFDRLRVDTEDLASFVCFKEGSYTRNLIFKNEHFELLLICWDKGAVTPVHDHNHSFGLMYGIQGRLQEEVFPIIPPGLEMKRSMLREISTGHYTLIADELGAHRLKNIHKEQSISLHLYVGPIRHCHAYRLADAKRVSRTLGYST